MKVSNVFHTSILKQVSWKTKTFFKKLEYRYLVEATKIGNTPFPFKAALSEANLKTNRMATTKWTYHKEWSFDSNYLIFWKICFSFRTFWKELIWCANDPDVNIRIFRKLWSLILGCFFSVSIPKPWKCCLLGIYESSDRTNFILKIWQLFTAHKIIILFLKRCLSETDTEKNIQTTKKL